MSDLAERLRRIDAEMSDPPWIVDLGPIVWKIRERTGGPQIGNVIVAEDAAGITDLRNALPAIIAALERAAALELEAEADEIDDAAEERIEHAWDGLRAALRVALAEPAP